MDSPGQFDDPVLKSAVRKAYADERASVELRRRVAEMAHSASPVGTSHLSIGRRNPWYGLAAAAILILAIGVAISQYLGVFSFESASPNALPVAVVDGMTATHDACAKLPDHHLLPIDNDDDMVAIAQALNKELARPVLAAALGDGWSFRGAGICQVGRYSAGHLLFSRGDQLVSLFSMPSVSYQVKGSGNYELVASGHPLAGFAAPRGLFCLVGSDPTGALTTDELARLRDKVRNSVIPTPLAPPATGSCSLHTPPPVGVMGL